MVRKVNRAVSVVKKVKKTKCVREQRLRAFAVFFVLFFLCRQARASRVRVCVCCRVKKDAEKDGVPSQQRGLRGRGCCFRSMRLWRALVTRRARAGAGCNTEVRFCFNSAADFFLINIVSFRRYGHQIDMLQCRALQVELFLRSFDFESSLLHLPWVFHCAFPTS